MSTLKGDPPGLVDEATRMIFAAARDGRAEGETLADNPYDPTSMAHRIWREGWESLDDPASAP